MLLSGRGYVLLSSQCTMQWTSVEQREECGSRILAPSSHEAFLFSTDRAGYGSVSSKGLWCDRKGSYRVTLWGLSRVQKEVLSNQGSPSPSWFVPYLAFVLLGPGQAVGF